MIKKRLFKYSSVLMCVVLSAASLCACGSSSSSKEDTAVVVSDEPAAGVVENTLTSTLMNELAVSNTSTLDANTRQELVYVFNDATGNKDHIKVTEKTVDKDGKENVTTTDSKENAPVTMKITYKLDGKEISPENLAGKSGKVTVRYEYTNNLKKEVTINGQKTTACVPFTAITGFMLPTDKFSNVKVTNGKITKAGSNLIVVGMALPGLKDTVNLKFSGKNLNIDIPEYVEFTADVKDFELDMALTMVTNNLLSSMNLDDLTADTLKTTVASLSDATGKLVEGTATLQQGTQKLADSMPELKAGVNELAEGAETVDEKMGELAGGLAQLNSKVNGEVSLEGSVAQLYAGMNQVNAGINGSEDTEGTFKNSMKVAATSYNTYFAQAKQLTAGVGKTTAQTAYGQSAADISKTNISSSNAADGINLSAITSDLAEAYTAYAANAQAAAAGGNATAAATYQAYAKNCVQLISGLTYSAASYNAAAQAQAKLSDGVAQITGGLAQLNSNMPSLSQGISQLTSGASQLKSEGTAKLAEGTATLNGKTVELANGVEQLNSGAITLKDGMAQFNTQAIAPITQLVGSDAETAAQTLKTIVKLGQDYTSFLGKNDGKKGSVTFIYKTAEITK